MRTFTTELGEATVTVHAPQAGGFDAEAFHAAFPTGQAYGLDVEGTYMDDLGQFSPDFRLRLIQFATTTCAWVLDLSDPDQAQAAVELLSDPGVSFCSHTPMDVISVAAVLGVDITGRNVDTRTLAIMASPDDKRGVHDLKTLVTKYIGDQLERAQGELESRMRALWPGRRNARKAQVHAYGWSNLPVDDEAYLTYAGLDAIACRQLAQVLVPATGAPPALLRKEVWLAAQANRIRIRGMRVDRAALAEVQGEAKTETGDAARIIAEVTGGLKALSPKLAGWLSEHGVDWDGHPQTDTGRPSLTKDHVRLILEQPLDEDGRTVAEQLVRFKSRQDALNKTKGVEAAMTPAGRVHPSLNTLGAITGRMSCSAPNMQNFSKSNPVMRGLFVPDPGNVLVTVDFDQVELRVVAALAGESKMIDTILAGGDLHQLTADEIGIERDLAKMVNFLIVYGGGGNALHEQAGIPLDEAKEIVSSFRERYPAINTLSWEMGRHDPIRTISYRRIPVTRTKNGDSRSYANINYLVQSSARDLLVDAWHRFATEFGRAEMVWMPIHDELVLEIPEHLAAEVTSEVERCMRFDFMGVPISATAVKLQDADGSSRWMTSKRAEKLAAERAAGARAA